MGMGKTYEYTVNGVQMEGYVAVPTDSDSPRPAVLIIHDWNGIDAYEKMRADMLAEMGYVAFCGDVYGKGIRPKSVKESAEESSKYYAQMDLLRQRVVGALNVLKGMPEADRRRVAAMGYCFGGTAVLEAARGGADMVGAISFHGGLKTSHPMKAGAFKGKVLALHGNDDPMVPPADVKAFQAEMKTAGVPLQFVGYDGAVHAFTLKGSESLGVPGVAYNEAADKDSWTRLGTFLKEIFR